jgi:hypothetical protein
MDGQPEGRECGMRSSQSMDPMGIEMASREAEVSGSERVNTAASGSGQVDDIKGHPDGENSRADETRQNYQRRPQSSLINKARLRVSRSDDMEQKGANSRGDHQNMFESPE